MLQQYELGDTIRRNATFCTPGTYYSYICIADGGYTYDGATSCIKKGVPGGPDDDNDGYIQSMNSPLNTYILRLADVYLTYAEACLGNSEELAGGPGLEALNQVRDRARIPRKERVTFEDIIRERRVEFSMEYCNWYDMVSWYHWKPDYMLNYFQNQHRGYTVDLIVKDEDGYLWFVGRADDVIKSSGYRIGPFEVESALMTHPAVVECAITGVPDEIRGQVVKATIVLSKDYKARAGEELIKELQNHVKKVTAPYKYPRVIEFVDELPKTISGKIRRVEIRENDKK